MEVLQQAQTVLTVILHRAVHQITVHQTILLMAAVTDLMIMTIGSSNGYYADGTPVGTDDPDYDTDQTRTIYRNSDGYPLVIYPNGDGTWCDDDGNTYDFANGEDVYDENGVDYYYHGEPAYVRYMPKNQ